MKIQVSNCSSPGASFTQNTDFMILSNYDWILEHDDISEPFVDFRKKVCAKYKISNDNARNIYPLLRNCGFVMYEQGQYISYKSFFTNTGLAYAKTLYSIRLLNQKENISEKEKAAIQELFEIKRKIILHGLKRLIEPGRTNYSDELRMLISFLQKYKKINKYEFAYMLCVFQNQKSENVVDDIKDVIMKYRENTIDIEVSVSVRNDLAIREKSNKEKRNEDISFLTSYSYFTGLLEQAGLVKRTRTYTIMNEETMNTFLAL